MEKIKNSMAHSHSPKSQLIYSILALFVGAFGIHNFYVGRWERGFIQLLITMFTGFLGILISSLWAVINIFSIETDGMGYAFKPNLPAKYICGILGIFKYFGEIIFWLFLLSNLFFGTKFKIDLNSFDHPKVVQESYEKIVTPTETIYKTTQMITEN